MVGSPMSYIKKTSSSSLRLHYLRLLGLPTLLSSPRPLFEASIIKSPKKDKSTTMGVEVPVRMKILSLG